MSGSDPRPGVLMIRLSSSGGLAVRVAPAAEGFVAGRDQRRPFVPGCHELEEQVRRFGLERDVANFVQLCGYPHSWTYADTATMPRL